MGCVWMCLDVFGCFFFVFLFFGLAYFVCVFFFCQGKLEDIPMDFEMIEKGQANLAFVCSLEGFPWLSMVFLLGRLGGVSFSGAN